MPIPAELSGQRFGRLTVIEFCDYAVFKTTRIRRWLCRCDCGAHIKVPVCALRGGSTKSCGCYKLEVLRNNARTHGLSKTPEYSIWRGIRDRCLNSNDGAFPDYGGRGITICERWSEFPLFLSDMGGRPSPLHTVERIDNGGNYEPGNCRWALRVDQNRNQRRRRDNSSGVTGVVWNRTSRKWEAFIGINGRRLYIGIFPDIETAASARAAKAAELGFNSMHGKY